MVRSIGVNSIIMSKEEFEELKSNSNNKINIEEVRHYISQMKKQYKEEFEKYKEEIANKYFCKGYLKGFEDCNNEIKELSEDWY